jgi:hypothetical protein
LSDHEITAGEFSQSLQRKSVNSLRFIVCGSTKIISFSVRRFLPMFWSLQNQNNGAPARAAEISG